jgi:hypothetical protein
MKLALVSVLVLAGCASSDQVLYDGRRNVIVYCNQAREHIRYLETEIARSKTPESASQAKGMLWDIRLSCASNI